MTDKTEKDIKSDIKESKQDSNKDKQAEEARRAKIRQRRSLVRRGPLYIPEDKKDPNFVYRIVNHSEDRSNVQRMKDLGYEIVSDSDLGIGDTGLSDSKLGSVVSRRVGDGVQGVLMRIPKDLYEEGAQEKEEINKNVDRSLTKNKGLMNETLTKTLE